MTMRTYRWKVRRSLSIPRLEVHSIGRGKRDERIHYTMRIHLPVNWKRGKWDVGVIFQLSLFHFILLIGYGDTIILLVRPKLVRCRNMIECGTILSYHLFFQLGL